MLTLKNLEIWRVASILELCAMLIKHTATIMNIPSINVNF
jgi:hypothetical protein